MSQQLQIGRVLRAHGVRGLLRVGSDSDGLSAVGQVFVGGRARKIESARRDKDGFLVALEGITDREQAEALRGCPIFADRAELPPPRPGELYVADLIGCRVLDLQGALLGEVAGSFPGGGAEILEVRGAHDFLLPLVDAIVKEVDLDGRRVVCDPPPGLIDLDEAESA